MGNNHDKKKIEKQLLEYIESLEEEREERAELQRQMDSTEKTIECLRKTIIERVEIYLGLKPDWSGRNTTSYTNWSFQYNS
jgi:hypothetical protein